MIRIFKTRKSQNGFLFFAIICVMVFMGQISNYAYAEGKEVTADMKIIFTTDIHGQLNSNDYETGSTLSVGGLARAYTLIKQARAEVDVNNSLTFDLGDVLYDYTTEYFYSEQPSLVQPIYQAMAMMGYDALTLGNHEFDYDYDYLVNQLKNSGLYDKVVVSNLTDSMTGEYPFLENMMITKDLTASDGSVMQVKIGVIGETFPYLSTKSQDFTGVLKVEGLIQNVTAQAAKLKEQGADLVIVLSHAGMGPENPDETEKNVSYALTKIDDVDVVLCGHEHNPFPSKDQSSTYYKLAGVNKSSNLVNDKNLVMAEDRGESIGVVNLQLEKQDDEIVIANRSSELRKATSKTVNEDQMIQGLYDEWSEKLLEYTKEIIGTVKKEDLIENFNGLVEDNSAIQLLNDAKRAYALNYIYNTGTSYIGYPVIAASTYVSYGASSYKDYVNISGELTESDLASLQGYNGYTALYKITGAQLKEWLEWSASAYVQTSLATTDTIDETMSSFASKMGLKSLVADEWLNDWSTFYVFDGIEYKINPALPPRYNHAGAKINNTNRVTSITYNGKMVTDDQVLVLAVGKLAKVTEANKGVEKQAIYKGYVRTQGIIREYIKQKCKAGSLDINPDYNWKLDLPASYQFLVRTTKLGENLLPNTSWFVKQVGSVSDYIYSIGSFKGKDKEQVKLLVSETYTGPTSGKVKVAVEATSSNQVVDIRYQLGIYDAKDNIWKTANPITKGNFTVDLNGTYTVYALDSKGNASVETIVIDNIYRGILKTPTVETYTNRKTKIQGTSEPGSTVVIKTGTREYKAVANSEGKFSYDLPAQKSGTKLSIYAINVAKNYLSKEITVTVKRTGPNQPIVQGVYNNSDKVCGNLNDADANIMAIVGKTVYVGNEETKELFKKCTSLYNEEYTIEVTNVNLDKETLDFVFEVPVQEVGTKVNIYTLDHISRASRVNSQKVQDLGPNPPEIFELTAADNCIQGYVTSSKKNTIFSVFVSALDTEIQTTTDENGYFCVEVSPEVLLVGSKVSVYAMDIVNNINRMSYTSSITVRDPEEFVEEAEDLSLDGLEATDQTVSGYTDSDDQVTVAVKSGHNYRVYQVMPDTDGSFYVELDEPLQSKDCVYAHITAANGNILSMVKQTVDIIAPSQCVLKTKITNRTKKVILYSDVEATMVLSMNKKSYESKVYTYDASQGLYRFEMTIPQTASGTKVKMYCYNEAGATAKKTVTIAKVVPDQPTVNAVNTKTTQIKGKIGIVSKTTIQAKIGSATYEGKIDKKGNYTIKIPKQKAATVITVWGANEKGKGITKKVIVGNKK